MSARIRFRVLEDGSRELARNMLVGNEMVNITIKEEGPSVHEATVTSVTTGETILKLADKSVPMLQKALKKSLESLGVVFDSEIRAKRLAASAETSASEAGTPEAAAE